MYRACYSLLFALVLILQAPVFAANDFSLFGESQLQAQELPRLTKSSYKASAQYFVPKSQKLKLRVTQIPHKYPWVSKDIDGKVLPVAVNSRIVAENIYDVVLEDAHGIQQILPAGSKFFGRVVDNHSSQKYQKDGYVALEFGAVQVHGKEHKLKNKISANTDTKHGVGSKLGKTAKLGVYTLASAIATPLMLTKAIGLKGHFLGINTNPYFFGGAAALGAAVGLGYGLTRHGKFRKVEPGTEFELALQDDWSLIGKDSFQKTTKANETSYKEAIGHLGTSPQIKGKPGREEGGPVLPGSGQNASVGGGFDLKVVKVRKSRDLYGDSCLAVTFEYKNSSSEELRYSSFKLFDSMGREYEPSVKSYQDDSLIGVAPKAARLTLLYPTEFLKTVHQLKVVKLSSYQTIASARVVLD